MRLGDFEVIYVAADARWTDAAEKLFRRFYPDDGTTALSQLDPEQIRMLGFFEARRKRELKDFKGLTTQSMLQHRVDKEHFSAPEFDQLYEVWKSDGESALRLQLLQGSPLHSAFRTLVLEQDYDLFGRLEHAS
jgi:hypothetical protein